MQKIALNFICKDESHVILKMLRSAQPIVDLIVAVDTGSSDNTREIIEQFGQENKIPTYVFERPFDNFSGSRNFGLDRLRKVVADLQWNAHKTFVLWMDCDEKLVIHRTFKKNKLSKDMHSVTGAVNIATYTRDEFFRLSKNFYWYGPIHEELRINEPVTSTSLTGIEMASETTGNSWKGHLGEKNKRYGDVLEEFIDNQDRSSRWVFMTAQSYAAAGYYYEDGEEKKRLFRKAIKYYTETAELLDADLESRFFARWQSGCIMDLLGDPWLNIHEVFTKAYMTDPIRGESIKNIIIHYMKKNEWKQAYVYSSFAKGAFFNRSPAHLRFRFVDQAFYNWEILEIHKHICEKLERGTEVLETQKEIIKVAKKNPELFSMQNLEKLSQ